MVKFALNHNNEQIRTLNALRKYCDLNQLLVEYRNGKLRRWFNVRQFPESKTLIEAIDQIANQRENNNQNSTHQSDVSLINKLVQILDIDKQKLENYQQNIGDFQELYNLANDYYQSQEYEKALTQYNQALAINPIHPKINHLKDDAIAKIEEIKQKYREKAKNILITPKADFTQLNQYLKNQQWQEADSETLKVVLQIMGKEKQGWLTENDCKTFPFEELKIMDDLWTQYSKGKFGFSVQKQIWAKCGGEPGVYNYETFCKFAEEIGWLKDGRWLSYDELTFQINVQQGYLPCQVRFWSVLGGVGVQDSWYFSFLIAKLPTV